jgi:hypothetical protein
LASASAPAVVVVSAVAFNPAVAGVPTFVGLLLLLASLPILVSLRYCTVKIPAVLYNETY